VVMAVACGPGIVTSPVAASSYHIGP
jgi:hypothetical protein